MDFLGNITFRRPRTQSDKSIDDSVLNQTETLNCTTNSMPEISDDDENDQIKALQEQIAILTSKLKDALNEIDKLSLENTTLKRVNEDLIKRNSVCKKVTNKDSDKNRVSTPNECRNKRNIQAHIHNETNNTIENYKPVEDKTIQLPVQSTQEPLIPASNYNRKDFTYTEFPCFNSKESSKICILSTNKIK